MTQSPFELVRPVLDCISSNGDGTYTAHFGYQNSGDTTVSIPVSSANQVAPGSDNQGQPVTFPPGGSGAWPSAPLRLVFGAGGSASWRLGGHTATASADSPICAYQIHIEVRWYDKEGGQTGPPSRLPADFAITVQSDWGEGTCSYPDGGSGLTCSYSGSGGLGVPVGTRYSVGQSALPDGWLSFTGVGLFPVGGSSRSFTHVVENRAAGGVLPSPTPTPAGDSSSGGQATSGQGGGEESAASTEGPSQDVSGTATPAAVAQSGDEGAADADAASLLPASGGRTPNWALAPGLAGVGMILSLAGAFLLLKRK